MTRQNKFNLKIVLALLGCAIVTGCGNGSSQNTASSDTAASMVLTIDNSGIIPVFAGSSTTSKIYVHNNTNAVINNINYSIHSNLPDASNEFTLGNSCHSIPAFGECAVIFTTPILNKTIAQGSAIISANYNFDNKPATSSQLLNYATVPNSDSNGLFLNSNATITTSTNGTGYATIYLYASGSKQSYTIDKLVLANSTNFSLSPVSTAIIGSTMLSHQVEAIEVSTNQTRPAITTLNVSATNQNSQLVNASSATIVNASPVANGAILVAGSVPLINVSNSESGQMQVLNAGNSAATIESIIVPNQSGITLAEGSNQCSTDSGLNTLAAGASCNVYFTVNQRGGSANLSIIYSGASGTNPAMLIQTVTWYNPAGGVLLQMTANPDPLNFNQYDSENTLITVTNVGGYDLNNVTIPPIIGSGSATVTTSAITCSAGGTSLPVDGNCSYVATVSDNIAESAQYINFAISGNYTNSDGAQMYSRVLAVPYTVQPIFITISNASESSVTQAGGTVTISATLNNNVIADQVITISDPGNPGDNIAITSNPSPCILNNTNSSCNFTVTTSSIESATQLGLKTLNVTNTSSESGTVELSQNTVNVVVVKPYLVYFAYANGAGYNGDLLGSAYAHGAESHSITNGIQGADYLCNNDESKPATPVGASYKAMIVDQVNRRACYAADCVFEGINENIDWVLKPTAVYQNTSNAISMITNESAIFVFNPYPNESESFLTLAPIIYLPDNYTLQYGTAFPWTGLSNVWTVYPTPGLCSNGTGENVIYWANSAANESGDVGVQFSDDSEDPGFSTPTLNVTQIAAGNRSCSESAIISAETTYVHGLICVQQ